MKSLTSGAITTYENAVGTLQIRPSHLQAYNAGSIAVKIRPSIWHYMRFWIISVRNPNRSNTGSFENADFGGPTAENGLAAGSEDTSPKVGKGLEEALCGGSSAVRFLVLD